MTTTSTPGRPADPGSDTRSRDAWVLRFVEVVCSVDPSASNEDAQRNARLAWCSAAHLDPQQAAMHFSRGHSTLPVPRDGPAK